MLKFDMNALKPVLTPQVTPHDNPCFGIMGMSYLPSDALGF